MVCEIQYVVNVIILFVCIATCNYAADHIQNKCTHVYIATMAMINNWKYYGGIPLQKPIQYFAVVVSSYHYYKNND